MILNFFYNKRLSIAQAILSVDNDESFEISLKLIETNVFTKSRIFKDEYPLLTVLSKKQNINKANLNKFAA